MSLTIYDRSPRNVLQKWWRTKKPLQYFLLEGISALWTPSVLSFHIIVNGSRNLVCLFYALLLFKNVCILPRDSPRKSYFSTHSWRSLLLSDLNFIYTVNRFVWVCVKFGTCTVVGVNWTLVEAKMFTFTLESTHFIFKKCPIYTHDGASAKFRPNSQETDYSVLLLKTHRVDHVFS